MWTPVEEVGSESDLYCTAGKYTAHIWPFYTHGHSDGSMLHIHLDLLSTIAYSFLTKLYSHASHCFIRYQLTYMSDANPSLCSWLTTSGFDGIIARNGTMAQNVGERTFVD